MVRSKPQTKFEPVQLKAEPGWYVRITLPHGEQIQMSGFETEARARDWIATKAADWLKNYRGGRYV
jgi:NAD(P)H-flavin reductase